MVELTKEHRLRIRQFWVEKTRGEKNLLIVEEKLVEVYKELISAEKNVQEILAAQKDVTSLEEEEEEYDPLKDVG
ncbi:hypothetical protein ACS0TY_014734 [Phlomoides rotata]